MAVRFKPVPQFPVEVTFPVPNEQGGFDDNTFTAHFKPATSEELRTLRDGTDLDTVRKHLVGWDMVDEETKQPVPFTPQALDALLNISSAPYHIAMAFYRASNGVKAKN